MSEQKHIVIITPGFPASENDNNCIPPLQDFVKLLSTKEGIKVSVITLQYPSTKSIYNWHKVKVYAVGGNDAKFPKRFLIWKKATGLFKKINAINNVDVLHSFWLSECALIGNYISTRYGIKHINTVMGKEANRSNRYLPFINFKKLKLIALSRRQAKSIKQETGRSADKIIPWGLNENSLPTLENRERNIDVLGVGTLISLKNFSSFVNIILKVKEFKSDINSIIVGDGLLKEKLKHQIKSLRLEKNITLTGNLPRKKVFEYMMQSKILLHTSTFESFGMVFIEALYNGLHVVSKPVGISEPSDRWKVCNMDDDFITAVKLILQSPGNNDQLLLHSLEETADSYLEIYFSQ